MNKFSSVGEIYNVTKLYIHEDYIHPFSKYDIALLKLQKHIKTNNYTITAICLPREDLMLKNNEIAFFTGWGKTNKNATKSTDLLLKTQYKLENDKTCALNFLCINDSSHLACKVCTY